MPPSLDETSSKPDRYFEEARNLLEQDSADVGVEQQLWRSMNLQRVANTLLDNTEIPLWDKKPVNIEIAAELAKALSKIHLADQLARLMAAAAAVNTKPGGEQETEMVALFDTLSAPSAFSDANHLTTIAQDCVAALSYIYDYHNRETKDPLRVKGIRPADHGYRLWVVATDKLFHGALFDDPQNLIESFATIAKCSPLQSPERLAAVVGLLRYPQYADVLDGAEAEGYIETLAPIGSKIRHRAEDLLQTDPTFPLKDILKRTRKLGGISGPLSPTPLASPTGFEPVLPP